MNKQKGKYVSEILLKCLKRILLKFVTLKLPVVLGKCKLASINSSPLVKLIQ